MPHDLGPVGLSVLISLSPLYAALQALLESMVDAAENLCPNVMRKAHIRQDLIHASTEKISIPRTLLKMSCWSSLELISLTKLGRFVMFINRGAAVFVNAIEAAVKGVIVGFIHTECM